jgi:uncharacterized protein (TIGR02271 family)
MTTLNDVQTWRGQDVMGPDGEKIGTLEHIYLDRQTGEPSFASVKTGLFGMRSSLVPVDGLKSHGEHVHVQYDKATIKDAPNIDADEELSPEEEQRLYAHYERAYEPYTGDDGFAEDDTGARGTVGHDTSGPTTDDAMTRSEEELAVGTRRVETGRVRLRKHIVTEQVQTTVPVQREEIRIEREPITDANVGAATDGPAISEEEHEVTLHAEEPVVEKRVVPKERVRLDVDTQVDERQVTDEVRKERIETEGDARGV